jgi:kynurenine formamidase
MVIDLTHPLAPPLPLWPGDPELELNTTATIEGDSWYLQTITLGEHTGTHIGVGAHMNETGISIDRLPVELLIRPAVVIDVREQTERNAGYLLDRATIEQWEGMNGTIESGSVVLLNTGRDRRWKNGYLDGDYPGYSLDAARLLGEERGVVGLGIDTAGIDGGADTTFSVNRYWLQGERYHLENLTRLELLPARGATIFIGALPIGRGSGSPVRVVGVVG